MVGAWKFGGAAIGPTPAPVAPMLSTVQLRPLMMPKPPRMAVLPSPKMSHAKPTRGPSWIGETLKKWLSYCLIPENGMPPAGYDEVSNVPCRTYGKTAPVAGLMAILFAVGQVPVV